jgi:hypothetical protein
MIGRLQDMNDQLIRKFSERELRTFKTDNRYHSPEDSETDQSNPSGSKIIITRDIRWRSDTVSKFLA